MVIVNDCFGKWVLWVIVVGYVVYDELFKEIILEVLEKNFCLLGLIGMIDLLCLESKGVIVCVKKVGIKIVMIIGDYVVIVSVIVKELGILKDKSEVLFGLELKKMSDEELDKWVKDLFVYVCVIFEDKIWIV